MLTVTEAIAQAKAKGFAHVKTYGGLISLDNWTPYGGYSKVRMAWYADNKLIDGVEENPIDGLVCGIWTLSR